MYARSTGGLAIATGTLAVTGFSVTAYIAVAMIMVLTGLLLIRFGRRRAAHR
jgi:hypothetical protein